MNERIAEAGLSFSLGGASQQAPQVHQRTPAAHTAHVTSGFTDALAIGAQHRLH